MPVFTRNFEGSVHRMIVLLDPATALRTGMSPFDQSEDLDEFRLGIPSLFPIRTSTPSWEGALGDAPRTPPSALRKEPSACWDNTHPVGMSGNPAWVASGGVGHGRETEFHLAYTT